MFQTFGDVLVRVDFFAPSKGFDVLQIAFVIIQVRGYESFDGVPYEGDVAVGYA